MSRNHARYLSHRFDRQHSNTRITVDLQKDVTRSKDNQVKLVRAGKFGEFLDLFGPVEKLNKVHSLLLFPIIIILSLTLSFVHLFLL